MRHSYYLHPLGALGETSFERFSHDAGLPAFDEAVTIELSDSSESIKAWPVTLDQLRKLAPLRQYHDGIHFLVYLQTEAGARARRVKMGSFHFNLHHQGEN